MRNLKPTLILFLLSIISYISIYAQNNNEKDDLRVFIDCNANCDISYIKTEINYVDFVPDRFLSNIYIMITAQRTGSGGEEVVLYFSGQKSFKGMDDTLKFNRTSIATDDEYRKDLVQYLKLGLTRFVAKTSLANKIIISPIVNEGGTPINSTVNRKDPWNFWVMNINLSGDYSKDDYSKFIYYSMRLSAEKTTEKIKIKNSVYYNKNFREITIGTNKDKYETNGYGAYSNGVKSINDHWSFGGKLSYENNTYSNYKYNIEFLPAVEYSLFPYKDAVKKAITVYYEVGPIWKKYFDTSYYGTFNDKSLMQALSLNFGFIQKWGNVSANLEWETFLNNFFLQGKRIRGINIQNFSFSTSMDIRIFKGLSFNAYFSYDITKGVYPNIRKKAFSREDILSNVTQYPTTNSLYTYFGLSYRFGSIYNNVVNPRFGRNF